MLRNLTYSKLENSKTYKGNTTGEDEVRCCLKLIIFSQGDINIT